MRAISILLRDSWVSKSRKGDKMGSFILDLLSTCHHSWWGTLSCCDNVFQSVYQSVDRSVGRSVDLSVCLWVSLHYLSLPPSIYLSAFPDASCTSFFLALTDLLVNSQRKALTMRTMVIRFFHFRRTYISRNRVASTTHRNGWSAA